MAKAERTAEATGIEAAPMVRKPNLPASLMYLGPTITENGVLFSTGRIFNGGLPPEWQIKAQECPEFLALLVPFEKVASARAELGKAGTRLSAAAAKVKADYRKSVAVAKGGK